MQELKVNIPLYLQVRERIENVFDTENEEEQKVLDEIINSKLEDMTYNTKGSLYYQGHKIRGFKKIIDIIISDLERQGINIETKKE